MRLIRPFTFLTVTLGVAWDAFEGIPDRRVKSPVSCLDARLYSLSHPQCWFVPEPNQAPQELSTPTYSILTYVCVSLYNECCRSMISNTQISISTPPLLPTTTSEHLHSYAVSFHLHHHNRHNHIGKLIDWHRIEHPDFHETSSSPPVDHCVAGITTQYRGLDRSNTDV